MYMEIDILTGSILIGLFLTNVILIFLASRQQSRFRQTEKHLQDALLKKIEDVKHLQHRHHQTETRLQDKLLKKIEEVKQYQMQLQRTLLNAKARLQDTLIKKIEDVNLKIEDVEILLKRYHISTLFDYQAPWWRDYSWLYRHVRGWQCEECQLSLNSDRQYLHTHHISGTLFNNPSDLRALCIACHSEQLGTNHEKLKSLKDYHEFMEKYGERWRLLKDSPPLAS